jgi:hypothetical protein
MQMTKSLMPPHYLRHLLPAVLVGAKRNENTRKEKVRVDVRMIDVAININANAAARTNEGAGGLEVTAEVEVLVVVHVGSVRGVTETDVIIILLDRRVIGKGPPKLHRMQDDSQMWKKLGVLLKSWRQKRTKILSELPS